MAKNKTSASSKPLTAQAAALTSLIDYQEGSVVSRTVIDKEAGTITLFAFDKGEGLSEHTAPYDALVYVFDGEADVVISGKPRRVRQGEVTIMPANEPHALKAVTRFKMLLGMVRS
ncbi:MAG: cupin domain-containing protein [Candidatus Bathyarchaeota archaeon]|nr:cupin domain-containing protein [Candidatus Bathyarchaeota archaeon]